MLRTLPENLKSRWPESVNKMLYAYNCTTHSRTGYSPFYLLFGREPLMPLDSLLGIEVVLPRKTHSKYAQDWKKTDERGV